MSRLNVTSTGIEFIQYNCTTYSHENISAVLQKSRIGSLYTIVMHSHVIRHTYIYVLHNLYVQKYRCCDYIMQCIAY